MSLTVLSLPKFHIKPLQFGCRLFAHMAARPYRGQDRFIRQCLAEGQNSLLSQSGGASEDCDAACTPGCEMFAPEGQQDDGWGIATFQRPWLSGLPKIVLRKSARHAFEDPQFCAATGQAASLSPHVLLAHLREGRNPILNNAHPFRMGRLLFMHNGNVLPGVLGEFRRQLETYHRDLGTPLPQGTTDTEQVFLNLIGRFQSKSGQGDPQKLKPSRRLMQRVFKETVRDLVRLSRQEITPAQVAAARASGAREGEAILRKYCWSGLNFVLSDGKNILASCYNRKLYLGYRRGFWGIQDVVLASRPMQPMAQSGQKPIEWQEVPDGSFLSIARRWGRMKVQLEPI